MDHGFGFPCVSGNPELTVSVPVFSSDAMVGSPLGEHSFDGRTNWEPLEYRSLVLSPEDSNSTVPRMFCGSHLAAAPRGMAGGLSRETAPGRASSTVPNIGGEATGGLGIHRDRLQTARITPSMATIITLMRTKEGRLELIATGCVPLETPTAWTCTVVEEVVGDDSVQSSPGSESITTRRFTCKWQDETLGVTELLNGAWSSVPQR
jgi:hypothetical protein